MLIKILLVISIIVQTLATAYALRLDDDPARHLDHRPDAGDGLCPAAGR